MPKRTDPTVPPPEGDSSEPETIDTKSMLRGLAADGRSAPSLRLQDLAHDPPLPELKMGVDKYQILEELGVGGMGRVYLVYDQDLDRRVALKMVRRSSPTNDLRFLEEAKVMAQLDHPNIVPVHDVGLTAAGRPYYTMRVVRGRSLAEALTMIRSDTPNSQREYSFVRRMQILVQIGQAVSYAHAKGVVHRDLKPANVMLGMHGEVQVMDWGLSKVFREGAELAKLGGSTSNSGRVVGTPLYMAPEQALGEEVDERADVYTLGVMMYELMTLTCPFEGSAAAVMSAIVKDPPEPPRRRSPGLPVTLEALCLGALAKSKGERLPSADALIEGIQDWLEAEADRAKRHALAEAKAAEGRAMLEEYRRLKQELKHLATRAEDVAEQIERWQPAERKTELVLAQNELESGRDELVRSSSRFVARLQEALGFEDDNATARELLADYHWERFLEAEADGDRRTLSFHADLVAEYHDGKYARELAGDGSLALISDPPGAEVWLSEYLPSGFVLVAREPRRLGTTPLQPTPLLAGSYLAVLRRDGYRDLRYPVHISRNRDWSGEVKLYTDAEIGAGYVHVAAGPCVIGGDRDARYALPRDEVKVPGFHLAEHPVTLTEYLEFLNDLYRTAGPDAAKARSPRARGEDPRTTYLSEDGSGSELLIPEDDADGDRWYPSMPVFAIAHDDAVAYCQWRSVREGRTLRLPTEREWEKAARGVDGRRFPWGNRFDPSLCNMRESQMGRPGPLPVDRFESDVSVYGVRGLGGNIQDLTSSEDPLGTGASARVGRVIRGGAWLNDRMLTRSASRLHIDSTSVSAVLGFRCAADAEVAEELGSD